MDSVGHDAPLPPLARTGLYTLLAVGLHSASQFWVVILLARYCSAESLGHYVLGYAVCAPVFMLLGLRLRIVLANDSGSGDKIGLFLRFRLITSLLGILLIAVTALLLSDEKDKTLVIILVGAIKAAEAMSDICFGGMQRLQMMPLVYRSILIRSVSTIVLTGLVIPLTHSATAGALAMLLVWGSQSVLDALRLRRVTPNAGHATATLAQLAGLGRQFSSLGITALLASIAYNVPRYFLSLQSGDEALGYYGAIAYFGLAIVIAATAATEATIPAITQQHHQNLRSPEYLQAVHRIYWLIAGVGVTALLAGLACGEMLLRLLFGPEYAGYTREFLLILVAGIFGALAYCQSHVVIALQATRAQNRAAVPVFAILLIVSATLVPQWGILGAALADLIYALLYFVTIEWIIRRSIPRPHA